MSMLWVGVGSSAVGAAANIYGANKAAKAAEKGAEQQIGFARESRDLIRSDTAPYRASGYNALNMLNQLVGLPPVAQPDAYSSSTGHPLYGDGNTPLTEAGLRQAYQDVLGRDADAGGLQHYLTRSPRRGATDGLPIIGGGAAAGLLGIGGKKGKRGAFTFNEFLEKTLGSKEYNERVASGALKAWEGIPTQGTQTGAAATPQMTPEQIVKQDPSYQFRMDEGQRAVERGAAARGGSLSGGALRAQTRYAQDYASTEYGKIYDRLSNIAGLGTVGTSQSNQGAMQYGQIASGAAGNAAYTRGSAYIAGGNAIASGLNSAAQLYGYYNRNQPGVS